MSKKKVAPAFPGRKDAMGYEPGLSKLEWLTATILSAYCSNTNAMEVSEALEIAKEIVQLCKDAEDAAN
jgi:hypothetical protein